jgi:GTP cyclohydrolase I
MTSWAGAHGGMRFSVAISGFLFVDRVIIQHEKGRFNMVDKEKIATAVGMLLEAIGEDPQREGLRETPERVARMFGEIFSGMDEKPEEHLSKQFAVKDCEIVIEKDIVFYSICEHHLMPFFGKAHIAYIPDGKVAGLSKLPRTVETFARRPQIQEQMTNQIADAIEQYLSAKGVMVMLEAEHTCMTMRGVKKPGVKTITTAARGQFRTDSEQRRLFMEAIK